MSTNERELGYVREVTQKTVGSSFSAVAGVGATVLYLDDTMEFDEAGGTLQVTTLGADGVTDDSTPYTYLSADHDLDTLTLSSGLILAADIGDRVDVIPLGVDKFALVALQDSEESVTALVSHPLRDLLPEGVHNGDDLLATVVLIDGTWVLTDMLRQTPTIQSPDYVEGESGWKMDEDGAQFGALNIVGGVGADVGTFNRIQLGDLDLGADVLGTYSQGLIAYGQPAYTTDTAAVTTTETVLFRLNVGSVSAGRNYLVAFAGTVKGAGTVAGDVYTFKMRYTTDGSQPTSASAILDHSLLRTYVSTASYGPQFSKVFHYQPAVDIDTAIFGFSVVRSAGTGTAAILATDPNSGFYISVTDIGARTSVGGSMSQASKATGTADVSSTSTYTKTFWCTGSVNYDFNGSQQRVGEAKPDESAYQGYYSGTHGNTSSMLLFDSAAIRAALVGATNISVKLTYRVRHAYYSTGLNMRTYSHNNSTLPSTMSSSPTLMLGDQNRLAGSTYSLVLPSNFGIDLKNGNARGLGFYGPSGDSHFYGYMYGYNGGDSSRPRLTITYTK